MDEIFKILKGMAIVAFAMGIIVVLTKALVWLASVNHFITLGLILAVLWVLIGMLVRLLFID